MDKFKDISKTIADYVTGMALGDRALLERAFHPGATEFGHFDGALMQNDRSGFIAACIDAAIPAGAEIPPWTIEEISVTGDTAVVCVENSWAGERFRDNVLLIFHAGRWQIVAKVFHHLAR